MRFAFRRSALMFAASLSTLAVAGAALAQETPAPAPVEAPSREENPVSPPVEEADAADADAAPASPPIPAEWSPAPVDGDGRSAFGLYLAGRNALTSGESATGARYLTRTEALTPEQPRVREQAFTAALLAGDLDVAARIAPTGEDVSPVIVEAGRLVAAVQTFASGDARAADALLRSGPIGAPHDKAGLYVQAWIAAAAGDWERALALPPATVDPVTALVARGNRARLLEVRRRYGDADAEWKDLSGHAVAGSLFKLPYGEFLERRGRRDEAVALYDAAIAAGSRDPAIQAARARAAAKGRVPAAPGFKEGAASALRTAADQAVAQRAQEFAVVYLRLSQNLSPSERTQLLIGQTLLQGGIEPAGRAALAQVGPSDPALYSAARVQTALSLEKAGRSEEALAELRLATAARPGEGEIAYLLAGQLIQMKQYDAALEILNGPVLNTADQNFEVHFLRGAAYEALDRNTEAEAELWAALQQQPNNPTVLNYLGYLWVDSGTRVEQGAEMIARAFAADPSDGNIQDSLGWAQFQRGQHEAAVETLEQAVAKEPANAEINDHLGDAYWAVGRQREAGFQWNRVLTLDVEPDRKVEVEAKLRDRLGQDPSGDDGAGAGAEG